MTLPSNLWRCRVSGLGLLCLVTLAKVQLDKCCEWSITKVTFRHSDVLKLPSWQLQHVNSTVILSPSNNFWGFVCQNKHHTLISLDNEECLERYRGREPFMSLIQVVQGHRAQCTLVDCSPRIHRSFLFPDTVQAAQPWGAWQSMTSPLFVCAYVCVAKGPKPQAISTSRRLQTLRAPCHSSRLPHFVNMLCNTVDTRKLHFHKVAVDTIDCITTINPALRLNLILLSCSCVDCQYSAVFTHFCKVQTDN